MSDLDKILKSEGAVALLKDPERLEQLRAAPETQQIFSMLSRSIGGNLEQSAQQDTTQLITAIRQLMANPEGAKLIRQMKEKLT